MRDGATPKRRGQEVDPHAPLPPIVDDASPETPPTRWLGVGSAPVTPGQNRASMSPQGPVSFGDRFEIARPDEQQPFVFQVDSATNTGQLNCRSVPAVWGGSADDEILLTVGLADLKAGLELGLIRRRPHPWPTFPCGMCGATLREGSTSCPHCHASDHDE